MKTILCVSLLAMLALAVASCAPPANTNSNANANTNAAPKAAAPTVESLMAMENKAWEAYKNKDGKFFEGFVADTMITGEGGGTVTKAEVVKTIAENKDELKSFTLSDGHLTIVNADTAVLTYKGTAEGTMDGKPMPSPVTGATVFVRKGSDWKAAYHGEVPVMEAPKPGSNANSNAASTAPAANAEKKEAATPPTLVANSNSASNSNSAPAADPLTDALMAEEKKVWEAWKAKDGKFFEGALAKDFAFVEPTGLVIKSKADAIKSWTTDNPCSVSSVSLSDGKSVSLSNDVAILVAKGTAVGTCGDQKVPPLWNTSVFVKEGGAWKLAYMTESPVK